MLCLCVEDCKPKAGALGKTMFSSRRIWRFSVNPKKLLHLGPISPFLEINGMVGPDRFGTQDPDGGWFVGVPAQELSQRGDSSALTCCIPEHCRSHPAEPKPCSLPNESVSWIINGDQPCKWQKSNQLLTEGSFIVSKNRPVQ